MAQANLRLAAGIGVVATCLLIGGPSVTVAMADPSGGHSGRSDNSKGSDNATQQRLGQQQPQILPRLARRFGLERRQHQQRQPQRNQLRQ